MLDVEFEAEIIKAREGISRRLSKSIGTTNFEDVWQNTCIKAWIAKDSFRGDSPFLHWLSVIACNEARIYIRTNKTVSLDREMAERTLASSDLPLDVVLINKERNEYLETGISYLLPPYKSAILNYIEGKPFCRVAKCRALKLLIGKRKGKKIRFNEIH